MILLILFRKVRYPWILKIDADERISKDIRKNIRKMVKNKNVDGYNFLWPFTDGEKEITKNWPKKWYSIGNQKCPNLVFLTGMIQTLMAML